MSEAKTSKAQPVPPHLDPLLAPPPWRHCCEHMRCASKISSSGAHSTSSSTMPASTCKPWHRPSPCHLDGCVSAADTATAQASARGAAERMVGHGLRGHGRSVV